MASRFSAAVAAALILLLACLDARAEERFEGHVDMALGARSVSTRDMVLHPAGGSTGSGIAIRGNDLNIGVAGQLDVRGGIAFGPVGVGAYLDLGLGGGASGPARQAGDILVRPSGFVASTGAGLTAGYLHTRPGFRARFEGFIGGEMIGIGLDRPGYPDTRVPAANAQRWCAGPRLTLERPLADGFGGIGLVVQLDARSPENVFVALQVSTLAF